MAPSSSYSRPANLALVNLGLFTVLGASAALGFNALANSLNAAQKVLYPNKPSLPGAVVAAFNFTVLLSTIMLLSMNLTGLRMLIGGYVGTALLGATFQVISTQISSQKASFDGILISITIILGVFAAIATSSTFALAATTTTPDESSIGASAGLGLGGAISFVSWLFFSRVVWDADAPSGLKRSMLSLAVIQVVLAVAAAAAAAGATRHITEEEHQSDEQAREQQPLTPPQKVSRSNDQKVVVAYAAARQLDIEGVKTSREIFQAIREPFCMMLGNLFCTFILYPTMWPFKMPLSVMDADIVVGTYQFSDFVGRMSPLVLPSIPTRFYTVLAAVRVLFLVLAGLFLAVPKLVTLASALACIVALGLTNGLLATAGAVNIAAAVQGSINKRKAGAFGTLAGCSGVAIGSAFSAMAAALKSTV